MGDILDNYAIKVEIPETAGEMEEDIFTNANEAVKGRAGEVAQSLPKAPGETVLEKVTAFVDSQVEHDISTTLPLPPYDEVLYHPKCADLLNDCFAIVERYRINGYDENAQVVSQDLMRLQGNLVYLAGVIGYINASVDHATASTELVRSEAYKQAKIAKDRHGYHITDADANHIARTAAGEIISNREAVNLVASTLRTTFYAIRSFAEELSRIANRTQKTERSLTHAD